MLFDGGCVVCGDAAGPVCAKCEGALVAAADVAVAGLDGCRSRFVLDDSCRTIIAALKYHRQRRLAAWLADRMAGLVPRGADLLTWVPATPERQRSRGFDQAQQLAVALGKRTGVPVQQLLVRSGSDARQTGQSRVDRLRGPTLTTSRSCAPFVVVADDVITTGSSLRSATHALRSAGAQRVLGVVAAATPPRREFILHGAEIASIIHKWT